MLLSLSGASASTRLRRYNFGLVTVQVSLRGAFFATKQSPRYDLRWTTLGIASQKSLAMTEWAERLLGLLTTIDDNGNAGVYPCGVSGR
jgi:hypothetical protein